MKLKPLPKKKYQRLAIGAASKPKKEPKEKLAAAPRYRVSRKLFRNILRRAKADAESRREPELKYPALNPSTLRALRNSNVRYGNLNSEWIDSYRSQAVEFREELLKVSLETMAQIEATRKASDNLIYDYGMPYGLDAAEIVRMTMKILAMKSMEVFSKSMPENARAKMLELYAEQLFSVVATAPSPYTMAPANSPFKLGYPATKPLSGADGFTTPVAGQSLESLPSPAAGRNIMPPRGLTL